MGTLTGVASKAIPVSIGLDTVARWTLTIGLFDKDTKAQEVDTEDAKRIVAQTALKYYDGSTAYTATGSYRHENGYTVVEPSIKAEVLIFDSTSLESEYQQVYALVAELKHLFNQESIAVVREVIQSNLW